MDAEFTSARRKVRDILRQKNATRNSVEYQLDI